MSKKIYLLLADGTVFEGKSFGAEGEALGEVVFTTGMVGYLETLTDPGYYGQIIVQTFPLIGNYGVIPADLESDFPGLRGYIVREWCEAPSNFRSEGDIDAYLKEKNVIGLYDIDTRALTRKLRSNGVMNGMITADLNDLDAKLEKIRGFAVEGGVKATSVSEAEKFTVEEPKYKIALWDLGSAYSVVKELNARGCDVIKVPAASSAEEICALGADGVILGNGAGDPAENKEIIKEIAALAEKNIPMCGFGLGHQLMALAKGAETVKMKYGHRGGNQPVRDKKNGEIFITAQNHGYAVVSESLPADAEVIFENVNDGTCEGIAYRSFPGFSVQFHPDTAAGPNAPGFVYERFLKLIDTVKGGND